MAADLPAEAASASAVVGRPNWLDRYWEAGFQQVEGWVAPGALKLLDAVDRAQHELRLRGGVMEIGIYRGRFFIALNGLVDDPTIQSLAIDLFADQQLNIDGSGRGDESVFRQNLAQFDRHGGRNVVVLRADSTTLTPSDVLTHVNVPPRIVSVDGGHTPEHTIADIELARGVLDPSGIVFVDDITNPHWLGVVEGVVTYLQQRRPLWPLAVGYNKLLMCPISVHARYRELLPKFIQFAKSIRFCGHDVLAV
jgi:hypothetical protein